MSRIKEITMAYAARNINIGLQAIKEIDQNGSPELLPLRAVWAEDVTNNLRIIVNFFIGDLT